MGEKGEGSGGKGEGSGNWVPPCPPPLNNFPGVIKSVLKLFADDANIRQTTDTCDILQGDLNDGGSWADK